MSEFHDLIKNIPDNLKDDYLRMIMRELDRHNPGSSKKLMDLLENTSKYDNYLTKEEYETEVSKFINQKGIVNNFHHQELEKYLTMMGKKMDCPPHYNKYVLFALMNYVWATHTNFIEEVAQNGKYNKQTICYVLATDMLKSGKKGLVRDMFDL